MKKLITLFLLIFVDCFSYGQSNASIEKSEKLGFSDLQNVLYFEGIDYQKFNIKSNNINGKNFQIIIKEFKGEKLVKTDTIFNSNEDEYFRIKTDSLSFAVLTKTSDLNYFKILFQFNGFSSERKYPVLPSEKEKFALKNFLGTQTKSSININGLNYFLIYMMPYIRKDKSEAYCEVAQSGTDPEKLYSKYKIPHYFLIAIKFE